MKKNILVIVAHPDDETLWMGGTLLRNKKKWNTTLICLTRRSDKDRYPKFQKVIKSLGVKGFIYDLEDVKNKKWNQKEVLEIISNHSKKNFDILFTHNSDGEYEHPRHIETHKAVIKALKKGIIKAKKTYMFSYHKIENEFEGYAVYNSSADILIKLRDSELTMKRKLAIDVYGYDRGGRGFEENSAKRIEAFDELK